MTGSPVDGISNLQPIVIVSSMEAEYMACFVVEVVVWIRQQRFKPTRVFIDNSSARLLAYNLVHHQRFNHIDISYHWILFSL